MGLWRRIDSIELGCTYIVWVEVTCVSATVVGVVGVVEHQLAIVDCCIIVDVVLRAVHASLVLIETCVFSLFYLYSRLDIGWVAMSMMRRSQSAIVCGMEPVRDLLQYFLPLP